jgi:hypothetical protein
MLDTQRALITDLGHGNQDETDVIMAKIREESGWDGRRAGLAWV